MRLASLAVSFFVLAVLGACGAPVIGFPDSGAVTGDAGGGGGPSDSGVSGGTDAGEVDSGTAPGAPTVVSTAPWDTATGVAINVKLVATFSAPMDPATLNAITFKVKQGSSTVAGAVASSGSTATFAPSSNLVADTDYTATISTGAKDLGGLALVDPYTWGFTTGTVAALGPAPVGLGTAGNYVILAKAAISTVPGSTLTGNLGLSPAAATYITGFSLVADSTNVFSNATQVVGKVYAANYAVPTPSKLTTAVSNMEAAYTDAAGRPTPDFLELSTGNIGGLTLVPGLYKWTSAITIPSDLTLAGGANDTWIFQTTGDLSMSAAKSITLSGGAKAKNVFWQVAGQVTLSAGSHFEGIILSKTAITLQSGATMNGRALAQTQVALQQATITQPAP